MVVNNSKPKILESEYVFIVLEKSEEYEPGAEKDPVLVHLKMEIEQWYYEAKMKKGLSIEKHREISNEIKNIEEKIFQMRTDFSNAYPFTGDKGRPYKYLEIIHKNVKLFRMAADKVFLTEYPDQSNSDIYK